MIIKTFITLTIISSLVIGYFNKTESESSKKAPVYAEGSIVINASPEKIWSVLTDIDHWSSWQPEVSRAKLNGEFKPNTTFDWKAGSYSIHSIIQTVKPYSELSWSGKVYGIKAQHTWGFKQVGGVTQVTVNESMRGLLATVFKSSFNKSLKNDMDTSLTLLKKACEASVE